MTETSTSGRSPGARDLLRLGERLRIQDRHLQARLAFEQARAAARMANDPARALYALLRQGSAEIRLGRHGDARAHLNLVLSELERLVAEPATASRPSERSPAPPEPPELLEPPEPAWILDTDNPLQDERLRTFLRYVEAAVHLDLGYLASVEEHYAESVDRFGQAIELFEALGCERDVGHAHRMRAITHVRAGDPTQATLEFQRAEACYQRADDPVGLAMARAQSNKLYHDQGQHDEAVAAIDEALAALADRGHSTYWLRYQRAMNLEGLGRDEEAFAELERAFGELVHVSRFVTAPNARSSWLESKDSIPSTFLARLWSRGPADRVHEAMQRVKSSGFVELLASRDVVGADAPTAAPATPGSADAAPTAHAAAAAYRAARERLAELDLRLTARPDPQTRVERAELIAELERLETSLDTRDAALAGPAPLSLAELQAALSPRSVLLDYVVHREGVGVVVVTRTGRSLVDLDRFGDRREQVHRHLDALGGRLDTLTQSAREALARGDLAQATRLYERTGLLEELHDHLLGAPEIQAALDDTDANELLVVPHRQLFRVPWHLLRHDGRYLLERLAVSVLPTLVTLRPPPPAPSAASAPTRTSTTSPPATHRLQLSRASRVLFLVTGSDETRAHLALQEVESALRLFRNVCLVTGGEASRRRLEREVADYDLIHFAGHAELDETAPTLSHLALGAGRTDPAWERLTLRDVLQLRLARPLVILSACQTARARTGPGEELLGLAQAFLVAGAAAVIGTHWQFEPLASRALLPTFYESLLAGLPPWQALRQAQLAMLRSEGPQACAYHWGTFACHGR